ncbi:MAG: HD domain-containing protein [Candidatus Diapherotrites archaeon]|nr:HD domain-containing protein [Candidatus Diapherotrites archaeon]
MKKSSKSVPAVSLISPEFKKLFDSQLETVFANVRSSLKFHSVLEKQNTKSRESKIKGKKINFDLIQRAYDFAMQRHSFQKRASGDPYFVHLIGTATILSEYGGDEETIAAGFLHDVLEDTDTTKQELIEYFGINIALLVEGVTKLDELSYKSRKSKHINYLQRVLIASTRDIRVLIIKLADKLHNVRTLGFLDPVKKMEIASLVLDVYGPLAHRMGLHNLEYELEDLCFPIVSPEKFKEVKSNIEQGRLLKTQQIENMISILTAKANALKRHYGFDRKQKGYYSIYRKISQLHKSFEEIDDFSVLLVLTDSIAECYEALGLVHTTFHPVPGKLKDYIAIPQVAYNAIHTTVIGPNGTPIKVHIKTKRMNELESKGIISWLERTNILRDYDEEDLNALHTPSSLSEEEFPFYDALKKDFLDPQIFVFTANGGIVKLPWGSSAVDFAYKLNTEIGNCAEKIKVNGKLVPIWTVLDSGDIVEVITAKSPTVKKDWIDFVKSHNAKEKIKQALNLKDEKKETLQNALFIVRAVDRTGLLADLSKIIAECNVFIDEYYVIKEEGNNIVKDCFLVHVAQKKQIEKLIERCKKVRNVLDVTTS